MIMDTDKLGSCACAVHLACSRLMALKRMGVVEHYEVSGCVGKSFVLIELIESLRSQLVCVYSQRLKLVTVSVSYV